MNYAQHAEAFGALVALLFFVTVGGILVKAVHQAFYQKAYDSKTVEGTDLLYLIAVIFKDSALWLLGRPVASVACAATLGLLAFVPAVSVYASIGYASLVFVVLAAMTPAAIKEIGGAAEQKSPGQVD